MGSGNAWVTEMRKHHEHPRHAWKRGTGEPMKPKEKTATGQNSRFLNPGSRAGWKGMQVPQMLGGGFLFRLSLVKRRVEENSLSSLSIMGDERKGKERNAVEGHKIMPRHSLLSIKLRCESKKKQKGVRTCAKSQI